MSELGLYQKLKQCKTMNEISNCIPNYFYDKATLAILIYWCLVPVCSMMYSYVTKTDADLLIYLSVLGTGILGGYITILRFIKTGGFKVIRKENIPQLCLFLMLVWSLFSAIHARSKYDAFIGDSYSHEGFLTYISYAGFYGSAIFLIKEIQFKKVLTVLCWVGTLLSVLTILQYYGLPIRSFSGYMKLAGTFHNTNHFGYYLTLTIMCSSGFFLISKDLKDKIIYLVQFILMFSALIFNNTFGSFLGVLGGTFITIFIFSCCAGKVRWKFVIPFVLSIALSMTLNLTSGIVKNNFKVLQQDTVEIIQETEKSAKAGSGRWELWVNAIQFIKEEPLFGYGQDNLDYNYAQVGIDMLKPHNEYIQHAVTLGIPALIFYLISLGWMYIHAFINRKRLDPLVIVALCVISGYLISAFVGNTKFYVTPYFMIFLALATKTTLIKES